MNHDIKPINRHIFLLGYMASGKTTFGRALSKALGLNFIDLDDYICDKAGQSVSEIFAEYGEEHFRKLETQAVEEIIADNSPKIIACGGGTPCFGNNMRLMCDAGMTVWLNPPIESVLRRLRADRKGRPLVASLDEGGELERYVADNLARRQPFYSRAKLTFDSSKLESEEEISDSVDRFIKIITNFGI